MSIIEDSECKQLNNNKADDEYVHFIKHIIKLIGQHTRSLRELKLSLQRSMQKLMNMAEKERKDW